MSPHCKFFATKIIMILSDLGEGVVTEKERNKMKLRLRKELKGKVILNAEAFLFSFSHLMASVIPINIFGNYLSQGTKNCLSIIEMQPA